MSDTNFALLYLLYGSGPHIDEAILSIASAFAHSQSSSPRIYVYTDNSVQWSKYPVKTVEIRKGTLSEWRGYEGYQHRLKIKVMEHALATLAGPILFCDSDTIFCRDPRWIRDRMSQNAVIMHRDEGQVNIWPRHRHVVGALQRSGLGELSVGGRRVNLHKCRMWNSGVVGLLPEHADLVGEALSACDKLYRATRMFNAEQFALSVILNAKVKLRAAEHAVEHYWDNSPASGDGERSRRDLIRSQIREWSAGDALGFDGLVEGIRSRRLRPFSQPLWRRYRRLFERFIRLNSV